MEKKIIKEEQKKQEKIESATKLINMSMCAAALSEDLDCVEDAVFCALEATRIFIESAVEVNMFGEETTFEKIKEHKPEIEEISKGMFEQYIKAVWK